MEKCGVPNEHYAGNMVYIKGSKRYRLHFNETDELESIMVED
jgi:hypothetical protein